MKRFDGRNKSLEVKIIFENSERPLHGYLVDTTEAYIHILDVGEHTVSYMYPWHRIAEVTCYEEDEDVRKENDKSNP